MSSIETGVQTFKKRTDLFEAISDKGQGVEPCNKPDGNLPRCMYYNIAKICAHEKGLRVEGTGEEAQVMCPRYDRPIIIKIS